MKKLIFISFVLVLKANAQVAKKQPLKMTDWYSLITSLIPNENESEVAWEKSANSKISGQWSVSTPRLENKLWHKLAKAKVYLDAEIHSITDIAIHGKTNKAYSGFQTSGFISRVLDYKSDIKNLFKSAEFKAKLLSKYSSDPNSSEYTLYVYELNVPTKKTVWLYIYQYWVGKMPDFIGPYDGLEIYCYFDKNEYLARQRFKTEQLTEVLQQPPFFLAKGNESDEIEKAIKTDLIEKNNEKKKQQPVEEESTSILAEKEKHQLSPMAAMLFNNVNSRLNDQEKNEVVAKAGITPSDTLDKTKKGKPKRIFTIYPTDINSDGTEDIFVCLTTSILGIPQNNYHFYTKDVYGNYQPSPGKIGNGVRVLMNGRSGYPDLIVGAPGFNREIWSWNGGTYFLYQRIAGNVIIPYQTMDIDKVSFGYTQTINNPVRNAVQNIFNGEWHSPEYNYSFRINGNSGIATLSNSPNYKVGDVMMQIKFFDGEYYHGAQIYTDGAWHQVTLKLKSRNEMIMKGGAEWIMIKKNN